MMDRNAYCRAVLAHLRRLTEAERAAVRAELNGHIEDHLEGLLALGYAPALAEERTLAAMGDPAEVGRELEKQYPLRWLIAKGAAKTVAVALLALLVWQLYTGGGAIMQTLAYRFDADLVERGTLQEQYPCLRPCDLRARTGALEVRVYGIGICPGGEGTTFPDAAYIAVAAVCYYDASWWNLGHWRSGFALMLTNGRGEGGWMAYGGSEQLFAVPVEYGEPALYAASQEGCLDLAFAIPLDWEGVA